MAFFFKFCNAQSKGGKFGITVVKGIAGITLVLTVFWSDTLDNRS